MKLKKNAILWEIQLPESERISYVFGTMHLGSDQAYTLFETAKKYINLCNFYAAETQLDELQEQSSSLFPAQHSPLSSLVKPKMYQKIAKMVQRELSMPVVALEFMPPMIVANMLQTAKMEESNSLSLDQSLWNFAKSEGKELYGIEKVDEQQATFYSIDDETQVKGLTDLVKNLKKYRSQNKKLATLYAKQDINQLYQSAKKGAKNLRKPLIYDRNTRMANSIEALSAQNSLFAAIGAGHLAGKNGVLALLKRKGFRVKAVEV